MFNDQGKTYKLLRFYEYNVAAVPVAVFGNFLEFVIFPLNFQLRSSGDTGKRVFDADFVPNIDVLTPSPKQTLAPMTKILAMA
jgi:hypothetical protein